MNDEVKTENISGYIDIRNTVLLGIESLVNPGGLSSLKLLAFLFFALHFSPTFS